MNKTSEQKRSAASWLMELAQGRRGEYALSIFAALLGVVLPVAYSARSHSGVGYAC